MAKIPHTEIMEGRAIKIQDNIIIGGDKKLEAAHNYIHVLEKLYQANLKIEPNKTIFFPKSIDIAGWIWQEGGYISVSRHRRSSLINTKEEDITKVKYMRSFIGLYKTLHISTPAMSRFVTLLKTLFKNSNRQIPTYGTTHPHNGSGKRRVIFNTIIHSTFPILMTS